MIKSVLQLTEKGLVDLNRPVRDFLPELDIGQSVTVNNLLTHTAGLPNPLPLNAGVIE
ncbi:MAG TPA: serine hydrolase domain-containing protein [Bacteroidales bacterium]|jgi:CubicO group peptidase (beta-lactamase class C family)|nr:serine hydrolase domain-containing protein [Bacteroidales bacterium]